MSDTMSAAKAKKETKERDGKQCKFCGMGNEEHIEENGEGLHAHHIIKDNDGGADHPKNLLTVCSSCHQILEHTQADALSRIKREHVERATQGLRSELEAARERVAGLEAELEEQNGTPEVFAWFKDTKIKVHLLLDGSFHPTVRMFTDVERATEEYAKASGSAKLVEMGVDFSEFAAESLRYAATDDVVMNIDAHGRQKFDSGNAPDATEYYSHDIPQELAEQARDAAQRVEEGMRE